MGLKIDYCISLSICSVSLSSVCNLSPASEEVSPRAASVLFQDKGGGVLQPKGRVCLQHQGAGEDTTGGTWLRDTHGRREAAKVSTVILLDIHRQLKY